MKDGVLMDSAPIMEQTGLPLVRRGKVRETYDLGDRLLMVATDRVSIFDVVLPTGIPDKGPVLNQMAAYWFEITRPITPNHFVRLVDSVRIPEVPVELPREIVGRAMVVRKAVPISAEAIVRGYITGSGWSDYQITGSVCGVQLPKGLQESGELSQPIFTPTTKADEGHDEPLTFDELWQRVGNLAAHSLMKRSLAVYSFGRSHARNKGIIIADTKFEFGWIGDQIFLIDEALTPDSSRFWPIGQYEVGKSQTSLDKQFVRDYGNKIGWDKTYPGPELPPDVVKQTTEKYLQAFSQLTRRELIRP